ncbi:MULTISPECIES: class I SAM-dependent methyltransferase [Streptomyces]|uniref:class I SAM-dependent methyltransferase n=1 Tax=Streptomyces TaxID=1883 RepID=UPI001489F280|nr:MULTISPECIES: class I SAM-dependent methyltransferase [Streptomyces]
MSTEIRTRTRYLAKSALRPLLYRHTPIGLEPQRLHVWTDRLVRTRQVPGAVVEIGCSLGGTAAWSDRLLRNIGAPKRYVCVDTFNGFVEEQFKADVRHGVAPQRQRIFAANSPSLVKRIVTGLGSPGIELIAGDIMSLPPARLPQQISACLVDVDLSDPVHAALELVYPRLASGGVIVVDDCDGQTWQARLGYERFVEERGLRKEYTFGMGIISRQSDGEPSKAANAVAGTGSPTAAPRPSHDRPRHS